ncbi:MAG: hypothetical protein PHR35_08395 [Kiritimatiellae bacterium]|nr:hypothetical protein [Kiritimatiellia bacterium]
MRRQTDTRDTGPEPVRREAFVFRLDREAGAFVLDTVQAQLRLACQGTVSQPGIPDLGTAWVFAGAEERDGSVLWRFAAARTCWDRKLLCVEITPQEVLFRIEVEGAGAIDRVTFFAGLHTNLLDAGATLGTLTWARPLWSRQWTGMTPSFATVFNPQPVAPGSQRLPAGMAQRITAATTFGPEIFNPFFAPPIYAYGLDETFTAGVVAPVEACRFTHFDYVPTTGWGLELDFGGQTAVAGRWMSPAIRLAPCASTEAGLAGYVQALRRRDCAPEPSREIPAWAWRPMFCGWGQQTVWANEAQNGSAPSFGTPITPGATGYATQAAYETMLGLLDERSLPYGTLTIDMGWNRCLTIPTPDDRKWTDLKGFIGRLHRQGKRVLLWLAAWNPGGLDEELKMPHAPGLPDCCDPTNPAFRARLSEAITQAISPRGLDADGFKVDFTGDLPRGNYRPAGNLWGVAMTHDYLKLMHDAMKAAKADAVLETHCANPQFTDVTEMIRLNDLFCQHEDVRPSMAFRSRMAGIALPGYPVDTDNDPFVSRSAWLDYMRFQPELGIPSLYTLTNVSFALPGQAAEAIPMDVWDEIRRLWERYNGRTHVQLAQPRNSEPQIGES